MYGLEKEYILQLQSVDVDHKEYIKTIYDLLGKDLDDFLSCGFYLCIYRWSPQLMSDEVKGNYILVLEKQTAENRNCPHTIIKNFNGTFVLSTLKKTPEEQYKAVRSIYEKYINL